MDVWSSRPFKALVLVGCLVGSRVAAQTEYANTDGGRPLRVEDATPTDRFSLDMHFPTVRVERIGGIARLRVEPALSFGLLPRTAIEARAAFVYRERAAVPRGGMTGFGIGVMHALTTETTRVPGFAIAGELYDPAGSAKTGGPAYSFRALVTKRLLGVRLHANGTLGSYNVNLTQGGAGNCVLARLPVVDQGQACADRPSKPLVPDGPCRIDGLDGGVVVGSRCSALDLVRSASPSLTDAPTVRKLRGMHRVVGLGADHAFRSASLLIMADVFGERYAGLFERSDWSAEVGARQQISASMTIDASVGRRFAGVTTAWVFVGGLTRTVSMRRD